MFFLTCKVLLVIEEKEEREVGSLTTLRFYSLLTIMYSLFYMFLKHLYDIFKHYGGLVRSCTNLCHYI